MRVIEESVKKIVGYEATDGTRFFDEEECKKYESSCKAVLKKRFMDCVVGETNEVALYECGGEDDPVYIVCPKSKEDVDYINQFGWSVCGVSTNTSLVSDKDIDKDVLILIFDCMSAYRYGTVDSVVNGILTTVAQAKENYKK